MTGSVSFLGLDKINGDAPLLSDDASTAWTSVSEVRYLSQLWCTYLHAPRTLVFLYIRNTVEGVAQFLGALTAGHAVVLLDPNLPEHSKENLEKIYRPGFVCNGSDAPMRNQGGVKNLHPDLSVLLSTSGSTGSPKFVRLKAENLANNAAAIAEVLDIKAPEVGCGHLPLHYSYGLSVLLSHLACGAPVHLTERGFLDATFWPQMRTWKIAHLPGVPFHYQTLRRMRFEKLELPNLRVMTQAGGALDTRIRKLAYDFMTSIGGRFHVMYGQTEAAPRITTLSHEDFETHADTVGTALKGGILEVQGEGGALLPSGSEGDIIYFGPNVMMGYAETLEDLALADTYQGRLATGDIGWLDEEGRLTLTGRSKRVGKVAGLRVNLDEVERLLAARFGEIAVTQTGEALNVHYITATDDIDFRKKALAVLTGRFTLPQTSYRFKEVTEFPRTSRNKIDYANLDS